MSRVRMSCYHIFANIVAVQFANSFLGNPLDKSKANLDMKIYLVEMDRSVPYLGAILSDMVFHKNPEIGIQFNSYAC